MTLEMPTRVNDALKVDASFADHVLEARFVGTADLETRADLEAVVNALHAYSLKEETSTVVLDFRELEFMNSSSFKVFVAWLANVQELPPEKQYKIKLRSNPNLHWQRRSLAALSCFAAELVTIEA